MCRHAMLVGVCCCFFSTALTPIQAMETPENEKALYAPNTYRVEPGNVITIPLQKAYAVWTHFPQLQQQAINLNATPEVELCWQDVPGLIREVRLSEDGDTPAMVVTTASGVQGNALVQVKIDGRVCWSWLLWVTDYNPDTDPCVVTAYGSDYHFMNRNLGALTSEAGMRESYGMLFQYARTIPFPSAATAVPSVNYSVESAPLYDLENRLLARFETSETTPGLTLTEALTNPSTFYAGTSIIDYDWLDEAALDTLWCGTDGQKGIFDPSPEGWRIPSVFVWKVVLAEGEDSPLSLPMAGSLDAATGSYFMTGAYGQYWSSTPHGTYGYYRLEADSLCSGDATNYRAAGYSVRCVREIDNPLNIAPEEILSGGIYVVSEGSQLKLQGTLSGGEGVKAMVYNSQGMLLAEIVDCRVGQVLARNLSVGVYHIVLTQIGGGGTTFKTAIYE